MPCRQTLKRNRRVPTVALFRMGPGSWSAVDLLLANGSHFKQIAGANVSSSCRSTSAQLCVIAVANVILSC